jgi:Ca2+-binding RTX toxin-like protein
LREEGPRAPLREGRLFMKLRAVLILATMVLGGMVLSGVVLAKKCGASCYGNNGDNILKGTNGKNEMHAMGGGDTVRGLGKPDDIYGDSGHDDLFGGPGGDRIYGGPGWDLVHGKKNADKLFETEDRVASSTAHQKQRIEFGNNRKVDVLMGDSGDDTIRAKNGNRDIIRGGPGRDTAYVDGADKVKGVEEKVVLKVCEDGIDNDGDGKIDFLQDPGCKSANDESESADPPAPPVAP